MLIDRPRWDSFIGIFDTDEERDNPVGITISRTYARPVTSLKSLLEEHMEKRQFKQDNTLLKLEIIKSDQDIKK
jgi:hypothetical protein